MMAMVVDLKVGFIVGDDGAQLLASRSRLSTKQHSQSLLRAHVHRSQFYTALRALSAPSHEAQLRQSKEEL
jgi:hypothetical protein